MKHNALAIPQYTPDEFFYIISPDGKIPKEFVAYNSLKWAIEEFDDAHMEDFEDFFVWDDEDEDDGTKFDIVNIKNFNPYKILKCKITLPKVFSPIRDTKEKFTYFIATKPKSSYEKKMISVGEDRIDPFYVNQLLKFGYNDFLANYNYYVADHLEKLIFEFLAQSEYDAIETQYEKCYSYYMNNPELIKIIDYLTIENK